MKVRSGILALSSLLSVVAALPAVKRDSAINEPAVEAPNGTIITLTPAPTPTGIDNSNSNTNYNAWDSNSNSNNNNSNNCDGDNCNNDCQGDNCNSKCEGSNCNSNNNSNNNQCEGSNCNSKCDGNNCDSQSTSSAWYQSTSTEMMDSTSTMYDSTSTMMDESTSTAMYESTSTTMYETNTYAATSTWSSSWSSPTYGSGYMPSSYDSCVQQCINSYGAPPSMVTATPSMPPSYNNVGSGATHTVIVAPTQGVLRYVPFAVNASVGDTVRFVWNAGPHTVTKSSALNLCNATQDQPFKSGMQNKSFVFDQLINDTNPTFYYCGVPGHCEKGMFGIINPPNAQPGAQNTAQGMMALTAQNNSDFASQWSYTVMNTNNNTAASNWGMNMDILSMTTDPQAQMALLQNVMFTRLAMAANDKFITPEGGFNPNPSAGMAVPMDPLKVSSTPGSTSTSPYGSDNSGSTPSGSSASTPPPASSSTSGARKTFASSATALFAAVAIAALVL